MENRFKLRMSSMFRSSFGSCRSTKSITDVIEKPTYLLEENRQQHHHQLIDLFSPKPRPFPYVLCRPKNPQSFQTQPQNCIVNKSFKQSLQGQKCPPTTPTSQFQDSSTTTSSSKAKEKKSRKKTIKKRVRSRSKSFGLHEFPACSYNGLFCSDEDEDDKTTLFSSRSLSSDSSESFTLNKACKSNKKATKWRVAAARNDDQKVPQMKGKVKDSFAVVKRSSDPYNDFRTSMVEMIVERQMFSAKDLENLLQCFLSLNSYHHHAVIIQVFIEIWEALFCNWSS
ncbi:hypothetical protein ACH5RR_004215 [Cinchona calisaya]|uniref:Transcription repressor n=1 Tax=Cinchona calisaya TaxID=153742 RepID=A0ABD3AWZ1_9GENT